MQVLNILHAFIYFCNFKYLIINVIIARIKRFVYGI